MMDPSGRMSNIGRRTFLVLAGAGAVATACGSDGRRAESAAEQANRQLVGRWVLTEFHPADPLEPMLASLLAAQMGHLTVTFDGRRLVARGMGVVAERTYEVTDARDNQLWLAITDPTGISYEATGTFAGPELTFTSHTPPWRGQGRLRRAQ